MDGHLYRDMTSADLSRDPYMAQAQGNGLRVTFEWDLVKIESADPDLDGKTERRLVIVKKPLGDKYTEVKHQIDRDVAARLFPKEWAMFATYEDVPTSGTPLADLPGITQSEVAIMQVWGLRSIEDLCELSEDQCAQVGREASRLKKLATAWLEKKNGNTDTISLAARLASLEAALAASAERSASMERRNIELEGAIKAMRGGEASGVVGPRPVQDLAIDSHLTIDDNDGFLGGDGGMTTDRPDPLDMDDD